MKERLDILLVNLGYYQDKKEAASNIMAGNVIVNNVKIDKSGTLIKIDKEVSIHIKGKKEKYVSRGGIKLEKAIRQFNLDFTDAIVLDIGASTGGFTHCALEHGASFVYAIDVGTNQLNWDLRNNPKVKSLENTHINDLQLNKIDHSKIDFITVDVSFISIKSIIDSIKKFMSEDTKLIMLIKPQFEAAKENIEKGGIVKNNNIHELLIHDIMLVCEKSGIYGENIDFSPIRGSKGNVEYISLFSLNLKNKKNINISEVVSSAEILGGKND
ncbi:TlyA family RNA methyltransferase [Fusobacterium sp. PH5-44]|uniref:TlyA family RNA methyltransferase n=1 Tax=unclassified Fusobacterium TaxID=2648384 RepID=UPI003D1F5606